MSDAVNTRKLMTKIGLPEKFWDKVLDDDDWGSIIKLHTLLDAGLIYLLEMRLSIEENDKIIKNQRFGNKKWGKLGLAKSLNLLERKHIMFLHTINKLRNRLAHKLENTDFSLIRDFERVIDVSKEKFIQDTTVIPDINPELAIQAYDEDPRMWIINNTLFCMEYMLTKYESKNQMS